MRRIERTAAIVLAVMAMFLAGCTFIEVLNTSEVELRVQVRTPDSGGGYTRLIGSGEVVSVFSGHGGAYSVTTLPNEKYRQLLLDIQSQITTRLFEERQTLTGAEVAQLVERLNQIDELVQNLGQKEGSCSGSVPDFETVVVVIAWDETVGRYALSCG